MTEGEIREIAFALASAGVVPGGNEEMVEALARMLAVADTILRARGIELAYRRVLPPALDDPA